MVRSGRHLRTQLNSDRSRAGHRQQEIQTVSVSDADVPIAFNHGWQTTVHAEASFSRESVLLVGARVWLPAVGDRVREVFSAVGLV